MFDSVAVPVIHGCRRIWRRCGQNISLAKIYVQNLARAYLLSGDALAGVDLQHLVNQVHGLVRDLGPESFVKLEGATQNILVQLCV